MGKLLIIKDADFSSVSVEKVNPYGNGYWLYGLTEENFMNGRILDNNTYSDGSKVLEDILNKNILKIKIYILSAGTAEIYYVNNWPTVQQLRNSTASNPYSINLNDKTILYTFLITSTGLYEIEFPYPIIIREGMSPIKITTSAENPGNNITYNYCNEGLDSHHFAWPTNGFNAIYENLYYNNLITFDYFIEY